MKNKRYRELAAILVMMTMTAGSITTVAAETEITAEEETTAETETDEPETETAEDAENADSEAAETADTQSQAAALEVTGLHSRLLLMKHSFRRHQTATVLMRP